MGRKGFDSTVFLSKLGAGKTIVDCQKDQVLFAQGDPADAVFYIQSGTVKMAVVSERGKEAVVGLLEIGSFFGEGCLNGQPRRLSRATALTQGAVLRIAKDEMLRVIEAEPTFAARFMSHLLQRNSRIEEDLVDQLFNSSEKRLARVLLLLANFGKDREPERILPKISQEVLAEMIGTTRSRVSFFMNKFRKLGFIEYKDTLEVHQSLLNVVLHD
jgi:CRP/FNR family transcriptional regulator, cyclic AMP receptor protein